MADRKYASDYRLEEHVTPDGGCQIRRVYQGMYYRFCSGSEGARALGIRLIAASGAIFVALLPMLFNNTQIGRTAYVLLPVAFTFVPLYHLTAAGYRMCRYPERLTRQQRDLTQGRMKAASIWLAVLLAVTVAGCIAYGIFKGVQASEGWCIGGIGLGFLISLGILFLWGKAETEEVNSN